MVLNVFRSPDYSWSIDPIEVELIVLEAIRTVKVDRVGVYVIKEVVVISFDLQTQGWYQLPSTRSGTIINRSSTYRIYPLDHIQNGVGIAFVDMCRTV